MCSPELESLDMNEEVSFNTGDLIFTLTPHQGGGVISVQDWDSCYHKGPYFHRYFWDMPVKNSFLTGCEQMQCLSCAPRPPAWGQCRPGRERTVNQSCSGDTQEARTVMILTLCLGHLFPLRPPTVGLLPSVPQVLPENVSLIPSFDHSPD